MAKARYQLQLKVYEQPSDLRAREAANLEELKANRKPHLLPGDPVIIRGRNVDDVLKNARAHLEGEGRMIRSLSIGPDGISAVVYKLTVKKDPRTMKESDKAGAY